MLLSAKHFPGHGDTDLDSHTDLPNLAADLDRIHSVEMKPLQAAIAHGVDSVMTAHITAPPIDSAHRALDGFAQSAPQGLVARKNWDFKGLIVTDAMNMAGMTQQFAGAEGAIRALEAGADVILAPPDPDAGDLL